MMFAQANSEHCRHKIFNARWVIDGGSQALTLFDMIRVTHAAKPQGTVGAYSDHEAAMAGGQVTLVHGNAPVAADRHGHRVEPSPHGPPDLMARVCGRHDPFVTLVVKSQTPTHKT